MTDEERVKLVRDILEQLMNDELDEAGALAAIGHVRDSSEASEQVARAVRLRAANEGA